MDAAGYVALTRQSGLMREMGVVANNIANASTTGRRMASKSSSPSACDRRDKVAGATPAARAEARSRGESRTTATMTVSRAEMIQNNMKLNYVKDGCIPTVKHPLTES